MESFLSSMGLGGGDVATLAIHDAATGLLLAFILGQLAAWLYVYTHEGLSYSRAFVQSIILLTVILSLGMMIIGNNIAIAFGLIGALAVIRFRNILKDTRDTAFIFFTLVTGLATGTQRYPLAVLGAVVFCIVCLYLHWTQFGSRRTGDGFMRFRLSIDDVEQGVLQEIFRRYCRATWIVSQRYHENKQAEMAYRLDMRNPSNADELVREIHGIDGISNVSFVLQEEQGEV